MLYNTSYRDYVQSNSSHCKHFSQSSSLELPVFKNVMQKTHYTQCSAEHYDMQWRASV